MGMNEELNKQQTVGTPEPVAPITQSGNDIMAKINSSFAKQTGESNFQEIPVGDYFVEVAKAEVREVKDKMKAIITYRILDGDFLNKTSTEFNSIVKNDGEINDTGINILKAKLQAINEVKIDDLNQALASAVGKQIKLSIVEKQNGTYTNRFHNIIK